MASMLENLYKNEGLSALPKDLLRLIVDYGEEQPHAWSVPSESEKPNPVRIDRNWLTCDDQTPTSQHPWYRIISTRSILNGPNRWTVAATLRPAGFICVGITVGAAAYRRSNGIRWNSAASSEDFVLNVCYIGFSFGAICIHADSITNIDLPSIELHADETSIVGLDVDVAAGTLQLVTPNGRRRFDLPASIRNRLADCRPCVVVGGYATATILDWTDDTTGNGRPASEQTCKIDWPKS